MTTDKLQKMYFQSMMQMLLEIVASYDLGDEVGRENLKKVLAEKLACGDLGEGNVKTIMAIFERLVNDVEERFRLCVDLTNAILGPSRADQKSEHIQFYNIFFQRIMKVLKIIEMERKNFDPSAPKLILQNRLEI
ncbi:hypothetical protein pipiens_000930, partial [Culex pipiens pipiens]